MSTDNTLLDTASHVRDGEQLDEIKIDNYLKSRISGLSGEVRVRQFPGGASNLTYLIQYKNKELVLRRPPFGKKAKSAHNMIREAAILETLKPLYPYVPEVLDKCDDHTIMDCDFFVMERISGIIPRRDMPAELNVSKAQTREICLSGIDKLIELHGIAIDDPKLKALGKGHGYVERQIAGWCDRYNKARTSDAASFEKVMCWLNDNMPEDTKNCVIHNDFRFDNLVYNADKPTQVIGVLDWEMATLGDPLMDLGNSLAYWVEAEDPEPLLKSRLQPTHLDGMLTRKEVIDYYLSKTKSSIASFDFYEIYGIFRLAVIVQQIYYRFFHGQTKDQRFAGFGSFAAFLEQRCLSLMEKC